MIDFPFSLAVKFNSNQVEPKERFFEFVFSHKMLSRFTNSVSFFASQRGFGQLVSAFASSLHFDKHDCAGVFRDDVDFA